MLAASSSRKILCVRSLLVVIQREPQLFDGLVDGGDGVGAVSAEVVRRLLQLDARGFQFADSGANSGVRLGFRAVDTKKR